MHNTAVIPKISQTHSDYTKSVSKYNGVCVNALVIFNAFEVIFNACSRHNAYVITGIPIITLATYFI